MTGSAATGSSRVRAEQRSNLHGVERGPGFQFGERMNSMPKFGASNTLDKAEWNATIVKGDLTTEVAGLKAQPGQDLLIYGSGDLVDELTGNGLIDKYRLMVHPVSVGSGKRLFGKLTTACPQGDLAAAVQRQGLSQRGAPGSCTDDGDALRRHVTPRRVRLAFAPAA